MRGTRVSRRSRVICRDLVSIFRKLRSIYVVKLHVCYYFFFPLSTVLVRKRCRMRGGGKEKSVGTGQEMEIRRETFFVRMYVVYRLFVLGGGKGRRRAIIFQFGKPRPIFPTPFLWADFLCSLRIVASNGSSFVIILSLEEKGEKRGMR